MKLVYIASPYSIGDTAVNVRAQIKASAELIEAGFCPVAPLLFHFVHIYAPQPYEVWMDIDDALLEKCDALWRLQGESKGADREVARAEELGIPVCHHLYEIFEATV
jgi:hypothetical protein